MRFTIMVLYHHCIDSGDYPSLRDVVTGQHGWGPLLRTEKCAIATRGASALFALRCPRGRQADHLPMTPPPPPAKKTRLSTEGRTAPPLFSIPLPCVRGQQTHLELLGWVLQSCRRHFWAAGRGERGQSHGQRMGIPAGSKLCYLPGNVCGLGRPVQLGTG